MQTRTKVMYGYLLILSMCLTIPISLTLIFFSLDGSGSTRKSIPSHPTMFITVHRLMASRTTPTTTVTSTTPPSTTLPTVPSPPPPSPGGDTYGITQQQYDEWTKVAVCEEGGWVGYSGPNYPDSLGINATNWYANGGGSDVSPDAQIAVAMRIQANPPDQYGCAPW